MRRSTTIAHAAQIKRRWPAHIRIPARRAMRYNRVRPCSKSSAGAGLAEMSQSDSNWIG